MARTTAWETHMRQAAEKLARACLDLVERMNGDDTAAKEIKEMAAAMKELAAMRTTMHKPPGVQKAKEEPESVSVCRVAFDTAAEEWKK